MNTYQHKIMTALTGKKEDHVPRLRDFGKQEAAYLEWFPRKIWPNWV